MGYHHRLYDPPKSTPGPPTHRVPEPTRHTRDRVRCYPAHLRARRRAREEAGPRGVCEVGGRAVGGDGGRRGVGLAFGAGHEGGGVAGGCG